MVDVNEKSYRIFRVESIHEIDTFIECREVESNNLLCEIRFDEQGKAYVVSLAHEVDLDLFPALIDFVKAL